ncbi:MULTISPECIES: alkane 1-monooxygenase [Acinetobacter]|uniref:Alkane 1-monooxygenase n=1 Tax=Acinetobacter ursingii TaxID=108980 RepID=A0A7T9UGL6_9GAMM|nr:MULTISPECIES: alkane 1-monooxygenase [Acinetobacter]ENX47991.1 alkane 1-monooxygenase [Acinetobacter ursingii NIPH 706]EXD36857.1 fatty acid desaturase family protein [Acinetobacter sp. 479375]MCH2015281.1 alkane 1-monooxygenase [Acinetobacter ursingii]MCU4524560.1 alkane 1-monooxygenase [Acinetobacter ursingii]MCU4588330.1 alkane 1-monooxygenase [Acinetobacter ursingii]
MNASVKVQQELLTVASKSKLELDRKRYMWMLGPALPAIGIGILAGYQFAPRPLKKLFALGGPIVLHVIIPTIDTIIGKDANNPTNEDIKLLENDPYYATLVKTFIPLQYAANVYASYIASRKETSFLDKILIGISMGAVNGIAINTAHELSHKQDRIDHLLSHMALVPTGYNHFRVEHPYGHHKRAATPEDPASSQMGETFYEFWPRTVLGSLKSAIEIETNRLKRKGKQFWSKDNELLQGWAMSATFHASMVKLFGKGAIPYLATQAFYGISLFEIINYIEHYGLLRQKKADGNYERTMPEHSWNNNNIVTNLFLYQLQRHSDHHAYPTRPFQALRHFDEAPELPSGYASMLLPALIPSMWFKMMDKRVFDHYKGDLNKANIYPKRRAKIFAKFGLVDKSLQTEENSTNS